MGVPRCAVVGLDPIQVDIVEALRALAADGRTEIIAVENSDKALALALAETLGGKAFDDSRQMLVEADFDWVLLDRQTDIGIEYVAKLLGAKKAIFSIGPPVWSLAEAQDLAELLEPRTELLYIWPRFSNALLYHGTALAEQMIRPPRFVSGEWFGINHARARDLGKIDDPVRSLSVLAWDALYTFIELLGMPQSLYAVLGGMASSGGDFADMTGELVVAMRFADSAVASLTVSDRDGPRRRRLSLWGAGGALHITHEGHVLRDAAGNVTEENRSAPIAAAAAARGHIEEFLEALAAAPSPTRGWRHRLEDTAAALEAILVSHRTGSGESPERLRELRR